MAALDGGQFVVGSPVRRLMVLAAALVLLGACGVGEVQEQAFVFGAIGVEGAVVEAGPVRLEIPPGALEGPTAVSILPQTTPLQVQPPADDRCTYEIVVGPWCCGPRGLALLRDGRLVMGYADADVPPGADEDDLVLLRWDEAATALVPDPDATHDPVANTFEVPTYRVLGHVAIGLRTCATQGIVFLARSTQAGLDGIYLGDAAGESTPLLLPGGSTFPRSFAPSPDENRVLFELLVQAGNFQTTQLWSVGYTDLQATILAGDQDTVSRSDPILGWLEGASDAFFELTVSGDDVVPSRTSIATVAGAGGVDPEELYFLDNFAYTADLRQSPDGSLLLIHYFGAEEDDQIDVIRTSTGDAVSQDLIPFGGGQATPRFLPDSSGVYLVSQDGTQVLAYDPDGTNVTVLFTIPVAHGLLKDFVLAPNGEDYAYIARLAPAVVGVEGPAVVAVGNDGLYVGTLTSGYRADVDLEQNVFYDELFFHPSGDHVFLDTRAAPMRMFATDDLTPTPIDQEVESISHLDIQADSGDLLLLVVPAQAIEQVAQIAGPGIYVSLPDGSEAVPVTIPSSLTVFEARWQHTIRNAPGMGFVNQIR
jgi:hypothetical protein